MPHLPLVPKSPLRPLTKTNRSKRAKFRVGAAFQLPKLAEIPLTDWELDQNPIEDQTKKADTLDDMCAAYSLTSVLEPTEGVALDPGYQFAKAKQREGRTDTYGTDLDTIGMTAVKWGALPLAKSPFPDRQRTFVADWRNWPVAYDEYAREHLQKAMLWVAGPYDLFDNIRATLWLLKNLPPERRRSGILAGSYWYWQWQNASYGVVPRDIQTSQPSGHAFRIRGQRIINGEPYLVIQNSYGTNAGDRGLYYFPRETVNREFKDFGQLCFVDMTDAELAALKAVRRSIFQKLLDLYLELLKRLTPPTPPAPSPAPVEPKPITLPMSKLYTLATSLIGTDASPKDLARDGLGCAESVSTIIRKLVPTFPIVTGTWSLYDALRARTSFTQVKPPDTQPGDIILCVTGMGNGQLSNGHVGILAQGDGIMSNDSLTGLWKVNFTRKSWNDYFVVKGSYPVHYFRLK